MLLLLALLLAPAPAEFRDDFDVVKTDPRGVRGWRTLTGDGSATVRLRPGRGFVSVEVDATRDRRGIWWALIERNAFEHVTLPPGRELRIEARVRPSHAPRRVNLQVLTGRSTDDYAHLMEFDLPDTGWHTISYTTRGFQAADDTVIAHLALMDWGLERYHVDLDYLKVAIVDPATAGPDLGAAVPYHPPIANPKSFGEEVLAAEDGVLDSQNPDVNLGDWSVLEYGRRLRLLTVDGSHLVVLRWDLRRFAERQVTGGLLELTTRTVARKGTPVKDFGILRVVEILGGDPRWDRRTVTFDGFRRGRPLAEVLNPQMIIDWPVTEGNGGKTYLTVPRPVLQRLVDGKSLGIALQPLGALSASFHSLDGAQGPRLHFDAR